MNRDQPAHSSAAASPKRPIGKHRSIYGTRRAKMPDRDPAYLASIVVANQPNILARLGSDYRHNQRSLLDSLNRDRFVDAKVRQLASSQFLYFADRSQGYSPFQTVKNDLPLCFMCRNCVTGRNDQVENIHIVGLD